MPYKFCTQEGLISKIWNSAKTPLLNLKLHPINNAPQTTAFLIACRAFARVWSVEESVDASSSVSIKARSWTADITAWQAPHRAETTLLQESDIHNKLQRSHWGKSFSTAQYTLGETALSACPSFQGSWMPVNYWHFGELVNARYSIFAGAGCRH